MYILEFSYDLTSNSYDDESCNTVEEEHTLEHIIIEGIVGDKKKHVVAEARMKQRYKMKKRRKKYVERKHSHLQQSQFHVI